MNALYSEAVTTQQTNYAIKPAGEEQFATVLTGIFFVCLAIILSLPLFSAASWMIFVQDDLLYYLKVAQNIAHGHGSTFNGVVPTNGYQPLWLLVLIALTYVTTSTQALLPFLAIVNFVAAVVTFLLARLLLRSSGVRPLLVFAFAAWVTLYSVTLFFYGMEVTLTVPIILGILCLMRNIAWLQQSARHTFLLGLLLSAMVLSRIDTLILGGLLVAGMVATPSLRRLLEIRLVGGVVLGMGPVAVYFLLNHWLFRTWLPVSGMAKELRFNHTPSLEPWRVFFHPLAGGFTLLLLAGLVVYGVLRKELSSIDRILFPAVILFPFVYYFVLSCVSDWTLWGWYMYPIRTALCVSLLIFCLWPPSSRWMQHSVVTALLVLSVFGALTKLRWTKQQTDIQAASLEIAEFAQTHPGTYAMGDRAGRVAFLIPDPVIQTEGLMMDRPYLSFIRSQASLRTVLAHYDVRYYVATAYEPFSGCFQASEPAKAGSGSAHMRAEFCEAPLKRLQHEGIETLIYDLQPLKQGAGAGAR